MLKDCNFLFNGKKYSFDPARPIDISLPLREGSDNPNCYYADPITFETIRSGDFVGSVKEGGPCNYQKITLTPHGNGTHTECYGHISSDTKATLNNCLKQFLFFAELITMEPVVQPNGDSVLSFEEFTEKVPKNNFETLIIRSLQNNNAKKNRKYSGANPPYLESKICEFLAENNVNHLLIDLPSVDKEEDGGALKAHRAFWQFPDNIRKNATITELVYVPDEIKDGSYLLNLQITSLEADASPSKPVLYELF